MKSFSHSIIIPSYDGDVAGVLNELTAQTIGLGDFVVERRISPAARARNLAALKAKGEYLIFIDDDVKFSSAKVLEDVLKALQSSDHKDAVNITWRLPLDANWIQRKQAADPLFTFEHSSLCVEMTWMECGAACFAIRKDWFLKLGKFDESLISAEDCDLAFRLKSAGGKIYTLPQHRIEHDPPKSIRGAIRKSFWYERGNAQLARKYPEADYRINLKNPLKAIVYLFLRSIAFIPLIFFKMNYRQRAPKLSFRPFETLLSYLGAWAYVLEWLFPSGKPRKTLEGPPIEVGGFLYGVKEN